MTTVFEGEDWYDEAPEAATTSVGVVQKLDNAVTIHRKFQYCLVLRDDLQVKIYTGGDIEALDAVVGQEVNLHGKLVLGDKGYGEVQLEIWPGRYEVVR